MSRITKKQKIIFANSFYLTQDGRYALKTAGINVSLDNLQKLLSDEIIIKYIDKYSDIIELLEGTTKEAHTAKLEQLFNLEVERKKSVSAVKLSERIEKLKGWDREERDRANIEIDLQLGDNKETKETEEERTERVSRFLKVDGVL